MDIAQGGNRLVAPVGFPKVNLPMIVIRQEYLHICQGDHCAAAILSAFETWTIGKKKNREAAEISEPIWIYKSQTEMHADMNGLFGLSKVWVALKKLRKWKFLTSRADPTDRMNRTLQYKFETAAVQAALDGQTAVDAASEAEDARLSKSTDRDSWNQQIEALDLMISWLQNQEMGLSELTDRVRQNQELSLYRESSSENLYRENQQRAADAQAREEQAAAAAFPDLPSEGDPVEETEETASMTPEEFEEYGLRYLAQTQQSGNRQSELEKAAPGEIYGLYGANIGKLTPWVRDQLSDLGADYGEDAVKYAIQEASGHNVRTLAYIQGVLKRFPIISAPEPA